MVYSIATSVGEENVGRLFAYIPTVQQLTLVLAYVRCPFEAIAPTISSEVPYSDSSANAGCVNQTTQMITITIKCTYQTSENPRGTQELLPTSFLAKLTINDDGTVASWEVDDKTVCFYTDLTKFDESTIIFEGSEFKGQTGSLVVNRDQFTFIQKSDVNGEWLTLRGVCEEIA